jgi:serine/threonine protein kinase
MSSSTGAQNLPPQPESSDILENPKRVHIRQRKWLSNSTSSMFSALSIAAPSSHCSVTSRTTTNTTSTRHTGSVYSSNDGIITHGRLGEPLALPYHLYPPPVRFTQSYEILEQVLGGHKGRHSTVWLAVEKSSSAYVAIKLIPRANLSLVDDRAVFDEVATLQLLNAASARAPLSSGSSKIPHWNDGVLTIFDFFATKECFFLVTEFLDGGDLFEQLEQRGRFREVETKGIVKSLLRTIRFIHKNHIAHRDLKPENVFVGTVVTKNHNNLNKKRVQQKIKVADFGLAAKVEQPKSLLERCGSPMYAAPEILKGCPYDQSCDLWSIGVMVYFFLSGNPPFFDNDKQHLFEKIVSGAYEFHGDWDLISTEAKDFIQRCLTVNPDHRITADEALKHHWFKGRNSDPSSTDVNS